MISTEVLIFTTIVALCVYFRKEIRFLYRFLLIPKSPFQFTIKRVIEFIKSDTKKFFELYITYFDEKQLTRSWLGFYFVINVSLPADIKIIMNSKHCLNRPKFVEDSFNFEASFFGNNENWQPHRKIINSYFGLQSVRSLIPLFNNRVKILMKNLTKLEGKGEFDVFKHTMAMTLDIFLCVMEYDIDFQNLDEETKFSLLNCFDIYGECAMLRVMKFWLTPDFIFNRSSIGKRQSEALKTIKTMLIDKIMENIRKNDNNNNEQPKSFLRALMDPKHKLTDREIFEEIFTLTGAGSDTSANTASNVLILLAMHKDIQSKVVDELKQVIGESSEDLYLDMEKLNELKYLGMVINEALRLIPVAPLIIRTNEEDIVSSEGYVIPASSTLYMCTFNIHRNKSVWGEDAEEFKPDRFRPENFAKIDPYAFIPFIKGPRQCIGWRYSLFLMKIILANVLLKYEIDTSLKLNELKIASNITMHLCQGHMITLKERKL